MIIVEPSGGLCNRMRVISDIYDLSNKTNHEMVVIWNNYTGMTIPLKKLFTLPNRIRIIDYTSHNYFIARVALERIKRIKRDCCLSLNDDDIRKFRDCDEDSIVSYLSDYKKIYLQTCLNVKYRDFSIFKPKKSIKKQVDLLKRKFNWDQSIIGIHIRRTDNTWSIEGSPTEAFISHMRKAVSDNPLQRFYLATDSPEEEARIVNEFGKERILLYEGKDLSRDSFKGQIDAYIELLLLSSCSMIKGSCGSTFSQVASLIGGIECSVITSENG